MGTHIWSTNRSNFCEWVPIIVAAAVLMRIEREDKQMLEGLTALLTLESTRLEGQRTQATNSPQTTNQTIQQQGLQTEAAASRLQQAKLNLAYEKVAQQLFKK